MRKENSVFRTKFISEPGSFIKNEDYFAFVELEDYACYCIADGIDEDSKRDSAKLAVSAVITAFHENPGCSKSLAKKYIHLAHNELLKESKEARLEVSMVILLTDYKKALWISAGNTRLFGIRNGNIKWKTKDTSLSQGMADKGEIPLDKIESHEERHNLYCYLGQAGRFKPVISKKRKLEDGDIFVMYTRGVWESVGNAELLDALEEASDPESVCTGLEEVILSSQPEIVENYTIVSIFVDKIYRNPKAGKQKKYIKIATAILGVVLMLCLTLGLMRYNKNKSNLDAMNKAVTSGVSYLEEDSYDMAIEEFTKAHEASEKVKLSKKSAKYKQVELADLYYKMSLNLAEARTAFNEEEYKKSYNKYSAVVQKLEDIKNKGEDVTFQKDMETLEQYAYQMQTAQSAEQEKDYKNAAKSYGEAANLADSIDATTEKNAAQEKGKTANGKLAVDNGDESKAEGEAEMKAGEYQKAVNSFQTARNFYTSAKDDYGNEDAADRITELDIRLEDANNKIDKQTNEELENEAEKYEQAAAQAIEQGDYDTAKENYDMAKKLYKQTGNTDMMAQMDSKKEAAESGPTSQNSEKALQELLSAAEYLSRGDYGNALLHFQEAERCYQEAEMTAEASRINTIITQISNFVVQ